MCRAQKKLDRIYSHSIGCAQGGQKRCPTSGILSSPLALLACLVSGECFSVLLITYNMPFSMIFGK
jgi:hypothetical protein